MGIFYTDESEYSSKLEKEIYQITEENTPDVADKFKNYFQAGLEEAKKEKSRSISQEQLKNINYIKDGIKANAEKFGYALGFLINKLIYDPECILMDVGHYSVYVQALKDKPEYYGIVLEIINVQIPKLKELCGKHPSLEVKYKEFIKSI